MVAYYPLCLIPGAPVTPRSHADLGTVTEEDRATGVALKLLKIMRYIYFLFVG